MNTRAPLRFAVLHEQGRLSQSEAECVCRLVASGAARLELIIRAVPGKRKESALKRVFGALTHLVWQVCVFLLGRSMCARAADSKLFHDVDVFACKARSNGGGLVLDESDAEQISNRRLDFVLFFGETAPADTLATVAAEGIWWFRYGDALAPSAPLAAFQATALQRDNVIHVALVRLVGGPVIRRQVIRDGYFAMPGYSFKRTLAGILKGSIDFPVLVCRDLLARRQVGKTLPDSFSVKHVMDVPGNAAMFKCLIQTYARMPLIWFRILLTREEWNTGFLNATLVDPFQIVTARNVRWLPTEDVKNIAADPFFLRQGNKITLLMEKLNRTNNVGKIAAYVIEGTKGMTLGTAIEEPFHSSYPCLVQAQGEIYCIPEQAESKSIVLYRAIDFPLRWECLGPLLSGVEAVDSTLFQYNGYWWLAYTDAAIDRNGRLMLWYANQLTDQWRPHALNPVKIDPRCSRGAGPVFIYRGALVRPSQDCSVVYGAKVIFNRIITLTPDQFHEEMIGELRPDPAGPYSHGLHTISYDGCIAVVDGKRYRFDATALGPKGRRYIRRHRSSKKLVANREFASLDSARPAQRSISDGYQINQCAYRDS